MVTAMPPALALALLAAAALAGAPWVWRALGASLNDEALALALRKLLDANNVPRALRLTLASGSPLCQAARAAILACAQGVDQSSPSGHYRDGVAASPAQVLAPVRARYDATFDRAMLPVRTARPFAALSAALLVATAFGAWPRGEGASHLPSVLAALGLLTLAMVLRVDRRLVAGGDRLFAALAPSLEALARDPARIGEASGGTTLSFEVREPGRAPRDVPVYGDVVKIGTDPGSGVQLDAAGVARLHAVVEVSPTGVRVIDLGARETTRVNGEPVRQRLLEDGDVIAVGRAELRLRAPRGG